MIGVLAAAPATGGGALSTAPSLKAFVTPAPSNCTDQWAMYQHDPQRTAASSCTDISQTSVQSLAPAWFVNTSQPVTASPTVYKNNVYVGDGGGTFYSINQTSGAVNWKFPVVQPSYSCAAGGTVTGDKHAVSYSEIASSAAVSVVNGTTTVFFGGGGSLFALKASDGTCLWSVNLDPAHPTSAMEVESSPVVLTTPAGVTEVVVGSDSNESPGGSAPPGVQALNAATGALLWKFEPENNATDTTESAPQTTDGCGDVWSSPSVDLAATADGMIVLTTGNCPQGTSETPAAPVAPQSCPNSPAEPTPQLEGVAAVDSENGCLVWRWSEPPNQYANASFADGGDDDFGSSPILTTVQGQKAVIEAGKDGYMYAVNELAGTEIWGNQIAQPGQTGSTLAGAIGGFIGSGALGAANGAPTLFGSTAIPAPFSGAGVQTSGVSLDTTLICIVANLLQLGPTCDPLRVSSLHAVNAASGSVTWQAPVSLPTYAAVTYDNGVVFAPSTTGFSIVAYDADNGLPLWAFPVGGAVSSGTAIAGDSVFVGSGTDVAGGTLPISTGTEIPPQFNGVWCFTLGTSALSGTLGGLGL